MPHRYVQLKAGRTLEVEATAVLRREGAETARVAVNGRIVEVPVIRAAGEPSHSRGREREGACERTDPRRRARPAAGGLRADDGVERSRC